MEPNYQFPPNMNSVPTPPPAPSPAPTPVIPTPTPAPAPQMKPEVKPTGDGANKVFGSLWLGLAVAIILAVAYFLWSSSSSQVSPTKFSSENVTMKTVDVANASGADKLPAGFLADIPVETTNISESTTLFYPDRKATLYSVSYFSTKQQEEIFSIYGKFLTDNGYRIMNTDKSAAHMVYTAVKNTTDLNVVITPQQGRILVQVAYVVRQ